MTYSKVTPEITREVIRMRGLGKQLEVIAKAVGISTTSVFRIVNTRKTIINGAKNGQIVSAKELISKSISKSNDSTFVERMQMAKQAKKVAPLPVEENTTNLIIEFNGLKIHVDNKVSDVYLSESSIRVITK